MLDFLPAGTRRVFIRGGGESFDWLREASELGWHGDRHAPEGDGSSAVDRADSYILVNELSSHLPIYTWGEEARVVVRAAGLGYGVGATLHATSLEEVFATLHAAPVGLTEDETRALGIVLILGASRPRGVAPAPSAWDPDEPRVRRRVVAAHYLRPVERDQGGHLQRRAPAVIATWDGVRDAFDHFEWALVDELGARVGRSAADFGREQAHRSRFLQSLMDAGVSTAAEFAAAVAGYRHSHEPGHLPSPAPRPVPMPASRP